MEQSSSDLDPFKNDEEFNKPKNLVKKEIDRVLKNLKTTKQSKFKIPS